MINEKIRDCPWEQFEEEIRKTIGSDFIWKIRPGDTYANRQAVMESIERAMREHNDRFSEKGDMFIEPEKRKPASSGGETPQPKWRARKKGIETDGNEEENKASRSHSWPILQ